MSFLSSINFVKKILWPHLKAVEDHFNISRWYLLLNWLLLRITFTPLSWHDYLALHLFNPKLSFIRKKDFLGVETWKKIAIKYFSQATAEDKLFFYDVIRQQGYRSVDVYALFHPYRHLNYAPTLKTIEQLKHFLHHDLIYPCFAKPVMCSGSYDTFLLTGYDHTNDILFDQAHRPVPFAEFYKIVELHYLSSGYIFQNILSPDLQLQAISNNRLCTMRILCIMTNQGPECLGALLKIPMHDNHADNFWRLGNIIAIIDKNTGKFTHALQKSHWYFPLPILEHPVTKKVFTDFTIPNWIQLQNEIKQLASIFPLFRWQSWDIAFTKDGWLPLELNYPGDIHFAQWLYNQGLKSRLEKFLKINIHMELAKKV